MSSSPSKASTTVKSAHCSRSYAASVTAPAKSNRTTEIRGHIRARILVPVPEILEALQAKGFFAALGRFREGVYVNFLGGDESPDRVREAYGDSVYDRLVEVKTTYDPDNVFHHNQNIRPPAG